MKHLWTLLATFLLLGSHVEALIVTAENAAQLHGYLRQAHSQSWVVFDIDDTLICKADRILTPNAKPLVDTFVYRLFQMGYDEAKILYLVSITEVQSKTVAVDDALPAIVREVQSTTPFVFCHTAAPPGPLGSIGDFASFRHGVMAGLGYDFSAIHKLMPEQHLSSLNHNGAYAPHFTHGILFSGAYPKGEAFAALLRHQCRQPVHLIFVDDRLANLQGIERLCHERGIDFLGVHFRERSLFSQAADERIAEVQFHHLISQGVWLDDAAADDWLAQQEEPSDEADELNPFINIPQEAWDR